MTMQENSYDFQIGLKYQLYNSIFLTLHFATIKQTGIELPLFRQYLEQALHEGRSPLEIIGNYFAKSDDYNTEDEHHAMLFRVIQYVERQVVLIDALEEAAFDKLNDLSGKGSVHHFFEQVKRKGKMTALKDKLHDFRVKIVLTAHPTQFYPGYVLGIINDLSQSIKENDLHKIKSLLEQLGQTPFFKKEKPTPFDEATSLGWYLENIFYHTLPKVISGIAKEMDTSELENFRLLEVGFWPGGDRDGNPFVSADITLQVARRLKFILYKSYYNDIRELRRRLTFRKVLDEVEQLERSLRIELFEQHPSHHFELPIFQKRLGHILGVIQEQHNGFYAEEVKELLVKTRIFGQHFASLDIRQDSRIIHRAFVEWQSENPKMELADYFIMDTEYQDVVSTDPVIQDLFKVFQTMQQIQDENGELACHRFIISNCRKAESVGEVYALAANMGMASLNLDVVPLFETIDDLINCHNELDRLYELPTYRAHLKKRGQRQYVMLGFSDGTKDGGYFSANWNIYKAKERMTSISRKHHVEVVFFDGRGGPPARGGGNVRKYYAAQGSTVEDKEIQLTIQGQTVSSRFSSVQAAGYYLENLLTAGMENALFPVVNDVAADHDQWMQEIADASLQKYIDLKSRDDFMPYLENRSPLTYFGKTNIGSRPSKRGQQSKLTLDDLRAIPFVGSWSAMKQNVSGYYGLGHALNQLFENYDEADVIQFYQDNAFFKSLIGNSMQSLSKTRMELTSYLDKDDMYSGLWSNINDENELTTRMIRKLLGDKGWEDVLESNSSIELRETIVLPLLIIQQYALMQLESKKSSSEVYENLIIRTLYGIINAARNSA